MVLARKGIFKLLTHDLLFIAGVGAASILLGLAINLIRTNPLPIIPAPADISHDAGASIDVRRVDITQAQSEWENGKTTFVDAREPAFFAIGHVPRAINLPRITFRESFPAISAKIGKDQPVIVYCSEPHCTDSTIVAKNLIQHGYTRVQVFEGGWDEWESAGLPVEK